MRRALTGLALTLTIAGCTNSDVTIFPPNVPQGGRAVAIAVSPSDEKRIVVATESGGLFRTFDGGVSFQHLENFSTFAPIDVAIASLDPNIVIATARDDFRTASGGGIWRSTDGGASWNRPAGWPSACPGRSEARGISHMPLSRTFYVATDCGIAVSADNGASFSMVVLNPLSRKVRDVLVINRTTGVAVDDQALWFLNAGTWHPAIGGPISGGSFAVHSLASPWWTGQPIFYHAGRDLQVYFSADAGATWELMATRDHGPARETLVRAGRGLDGDPTHFDVYFGDGFAFYRQAVTTVVPGGSNAWTSPTHVDHRDPADVAFTPGNVKPLMMASDGGVHLTKDSGRTWKLTGSNTGGFMALQIGEVTGRAVGGSEAHLDLFYATHDNDIKGSSDGGQTWDGSVGAEGAFLNADAANPAHVDGPVTGRQCDNCRIFQSAVHLGNTSNNPPFHNAPDGNTLGGAEPPNQILGPRYLQDVPNTGTPKSFDFFFTQNNGIAWTPSFSLSFAPFGTVKFAGSLSNPVAYVGVKRGGNTIGLFRAQDVATQAIVRRADTTGMGSIGVLRTGQATYAVFGVDPSHPDHLIAADVSANMMKASANGGITWFPLAGLTTAVTDSGRFLFKKNMSSSATVIAWDPTNTCHILIGTMQNGVIRSADGGLTWRRVAGSTAATYVTSFFFPPTGRIWMSTYGRGLWTIGVDRSTPSGSRCAFPRPPGSPLDTLVVYPITTRELRPFGGLTDTIVCPTCTVVAAHNGWFTDVTMMERGNVKEVAISAGMVSERDHNGKEVLLSVPNSYADNEGENLYRLINRDLLGMRRVRGLVLRRKQLVALILSRDELPLASTRTPLVYLMNSDSSGVPSVVQSGASVQLFGQGFVPGVGTGARAVNVLIGPDTVARGLSVGRDGNFSTELSVSRGPGLLEVIVVQRDGNRFTMQRAEITVIAHESGVDMRVKKGKQR